LVRIYLWGEALLIDIREYPIDTSPRSEDLLWSEKESPLVLYHIEKKELMGAQIRLLISGDRLSCDDLMRLTSITRLIEKPERYLLLRIERYDDPIGLIIWIGMSC
jgi:hypothetical protein